MLRRRGGGKKTDADGEEIKGGKGVMKMLGTGVKRGERVMDMHLDESVMTSLGKLKVIV